MYLTMQQKGGPATGLSVRRKLISEPTRILYLIRLPGSRNAASGTFILSSGNLPNDPDSTCSSSHMSVPWLPLLSPLSCRAVVDRRSPTTFHDVFYTSGPPFPFPTCFAGSHSLWSFGNLDHVQITSRL